VRAHLGNAMYGALDYAAYPIGMLLVAPVVLHRLGVAEYGLWTVATAAVSTGGIIASGFGDANIQHVAKLRRPDQKDALERAVRSMIGINLTLGLALSLAALLLAPAAMRHLVPSGVAQQRNGLLVLRIASLLMLVRALESVSISTLRAFERYGAAVRISIGARLLTLIAAAVLAYAGYGTGSIMEATALLLVLGTTAQFLRLHRFLGGVSLWPAFNPEATKALFGFGVFSWLQAVTGVVFGQIDRLVLGISLGAAAVAPYALCIQLTQPIYGLTASGLHFLFPYLAGRAGTLSSSELRRTLQRAFACNLLVVCMGTVLLLLFGTRILRVWAGEGIARSAAPVFPLIIAGSALLGLSVTGNYAMLALGRVRTAAWFNIAGGGAMLLMMGWFLRHSGVVGLGIDRLFYGLLSLLLYWPLLRILRHVGGGGRVMAIAAAMPLSEIEEVPRG